MILVGLVFYWALWHACLQVAQGHCPLCGFCAPPAHLEPRAMQLPAGSYLTQARFSSFWCGSWFLCANCLCIEDLTWGSLLAKASTL